ncbi:group-specific protein [Lysinibacillus sp. FSL H8-0500]|uniref:group-specific protein n=1 Tax=Lysinibacillus sp. FSL H8-0500 TaxID=2921393 RepID=UPI0031012F21
MQSEKLRLRKIQRLAYEIMDEMHKEKNQLELHKFIPIIDNLARAIGDLTDSTGQYSLDYVEEKVKNAHAFLFSKEKVDIYS